MPTYRKIKGKLYRLGARHDTKSAAQRAAASDHRAGFRTRITQEDGKYVGRVSVANYSASDAEMRRLMREP